MLPNEITNWNWNLAQKQMCGLKLQVGPTPNGTFWQVYEMGVLSNNGPAANADDAINQAEAWAKKTASYARCIAMGFQWDPGQWFAPDQP